MLATLCVTIVAFLYAPAMMSRTNGQTLGRMVLGIRVVRAKGQPMTFWFAMLREVVIKALLFGIASSLTFGSPACSTSCGRCGTRRTGRSTTSWSTRG